LRNSSSLPGILPSLPDSFPAVLAVKVPLCRGSAATLTAAGRRESAPLGALGRKGELRKLPPPCFSSLHLRKIQLPLQLLLHKPDIKPLRLQPFFQSLAQNLRTVTLQNLVQTIYIHPPPPRPTMHQLGQIANRRFP